MEPSEEEKESTLVDIKRYMDKILHVLTRMGGTFKPSPVLATVARVVHRDAIITKNRDLQKVEGLSQVFINADEPLQVRLAKAMLRRAAYIARALMVMHLCQCPRTPQDVKSL